MTCSRWCVPVAIVLADVIATPGRGDWDLRQLSAGLGQSAPCRPAANSAPQHLRLQRVMELVGFYDVTFVRERGTVRDSVIATRLGLDSAPEHRREMPSSLRRRVLEGIATLDSAAFAPMVLARIDSLPPGGFDVVGHYAYPESTLTMWIGSGALDERAIWADVGIQLEVVRAHDRVILGRWREGGLAAGGASGYFCGTRVPGQ